ncbi:tyrosine-type recombinase/integrase [Nguyenibacter vanlangensis]|uniref:Tyrosine-type recombinase/integrase n=1 Tax=Nguyenibacter vanlangensis TaxID=1216886 RepID=A0ABZ3D008_9PROT
MPKITKRAITAAEPAAKDYFLWDDSIPAFAVRVWPSGRKVYVIHYRSGGRMRRYTIGQHGSPWTADLAREEAIKVLARVHDGENPADVRAEERRSMRVKEFGKRFLEEYVDIHLKPTTQAEYKRSVDLFIVPKFGSWRVADITRADIADFHGEQRHIPYQANRTLGVISKMFSLADLWGIRADGINPCRGVRRYKEEKRERYLTGEEYARLGATLDATEDMPEAVWAIRLLALTGCRLREIQTLQWDHVYLDHAELRLPDSKTGAKIVQLGQAAVEVLKSILRVKDNPYVITGRKKGGHLTDLQKPWRRIRKAAGLDGVRIHDLRHSFASDALEMGADLTMIGRMLGHSDIKTTARYAHLKRENVRISTDKVAERISTVLSGRKDPSAEADAPVEGIAQEATTAIAA